MQRDKPLSFLTYKLLGRLRDVGRGITNARYGQVSAIVKEDHDEAPAQIYCEIVACRLAALVGAPVAIGALVAHDTGLKFASLVLSEVSRRLLIIDSPRVPRALNRYAEECATLAVFDLWIGNTDRLGNVKANLDVHSDRIIVGIDHGAALLNCAETAQKAIDQLGRMDWPRTHCFLSEEGGPWIERAIERIERLDPDMILYACDLKASVGSATVMFQVELSEQLTKRRQFLREIVANALGSSGGKRMLCRSAKCSS